MACAYTSNPQPITTTTTTSTTTSTPHHSPSHTVPHLQGHAQCVAGDERDGRGGGNQSSALETSKQASMEYTGLLDRLNQGECRAQQAQALTRRSWQGHRLC